MKRKSSNSSDYPDLDFIESLTSGADEVNAAVIQRIIQRLSQENQRLKTRLKNTKAVIQTREEEITQQRQQIDQLCAAEISKKEMHKLICDQAQALSDLLSERRESEKA
jgi:DNA-binding transcriptional MerR regulator|tara:strand:+ start:445 stop:771 length:327 start_codon:yes stop_codon:yes gene_type:complete